MWWRRSLLAGLPLSLTLVLGVAGPAFPQIPLRFQQPAMMTSQVPFITMPVPIDPLTSTVTIRIARPTTLSPRTWGPSDRLRVSVVLTVDGIEYRCTGQASGGVRARPGGGEADEYILSYQPPSGWFGARSGPQKRLGETRRATYTAHIEIALLSGSLVESEIAVETTVSPAPADLFHSSVAFDAVTTAKEFNGDKIISLSHTSTGDNRAVFAGSGAGADAQITSTGTTYGGTAMTEMWDIAVGNFSNAGYRLAGQATGVQTVTNTLDAGLPVANHFLAVVSMTGVDQTTPVGTPATATGLTNASSVTVASVGTDDMVIDHVASGWGLMTPGADQTERYDIGDGFLQLSGTTQPGSAGGVMTQTADSIVFDTQWTVGAVAFKPAAAGASPPQRSLLGVGQ